jgi:hypothetical protein
MYVETYHIKCLVSSESITDDETYASVVGLEGVDFGSEFVVEAVYDDRFSVASSLTLFKHLGEISGTEMTCESDETSYQW